VFEEHCVICDAAFAKGGSPPVLMNELCKPRLGFGADFSEGVRRPANPGVPPPLFADSVIYLSISWNHVFTICDVGY